MPDGRRRVVITQGRRVMTGDTLAEWVVIVHGTTATLLMFLGILDRNRHTQLLRARSPYSPFATNDEFIGTRRPPASRARAPLCAARRINDLAVDVSARAPYERADDEPARLARACSYSGSGAMSAPLGHAIVPASEST